MPPASITPGEVAMEAECLLLDWRAQPTAIDS